MKPNTVTFTTKGQIVIPARLRKEFHIEPGSRAIVEQTEDGILLRPMTQWAIEKARGILPPSDGNFRAEWEEYKREERALEERRLGPGGTR